MLVVEPDAAAAVLHRRIHTHAAIAAVAGRELRLLLLVLVLLAMAVVVGNVVVLLLLLLLLMSATATAPHTAAATASSASARKSVELQWGRGKSLRDLVPLLLVRPAQLRAVAPEVVAISGLHRRCSHDAAAAAAHRHTHA